MTEPDSSPDTSIVDGAEIDTATQDANPAESSAADSGGKSLIADIQAALAPKESPDSEKPDQSSDADEDTPETEEEGTSEEGDDDAISDEELDRLNRKTRRRVKRLLSVIEEKNDELTSIKPKAEAFDKVVSQVRDAGLEAGEVDWLLTKLGKNLKRNPAEAYRQITPIYQRLQSMFGDVLPPDLEQQVKTGRITREAAQAVVRSQTQATLASQEAERVRQEQAAAEEARNTDAQVDRIRAAATEWEQRQIAADPDWKRKGPQVMEQIELELGRFTRGGGKLSVDKVAEIANTAKKMVDDRFKQFVPRPTEVKPVTGVSSSASHAKPTNAVEAAKLALASMRA